MGRGLTKIVAVAHPFSRDIGANLRRIGQTLRQAREQGAALVVFPECSLGGYMRESGYGASAPELPRPLEPDGPVIARLAELAGDIVVCLGYTEAAGRRRPYSSAVCVSGDGVLGHHRKVHLPPAERFAYSAGGGFAAFDTPVGRIGMLLCYDKVFAEASTALARDGAQIVASMAAWPVDRRRPAERTAADRQLRHFDVLDQARAIEHQVVWVSANATGRWGPLRFPGGSKVVDPDGVVLASTGQRPGLAVAEIDAAAATESVRADIDHLADRRPYAYVPRPVPAVLHSSKVG
jgi:N-carbamoylputrescine amidase